MLLQVLLLLAYSVSLLSCKYIYDGGYKKSVNQLGISTMLILSLWALVELAISVAIDAEEVGRLAKWHSSLIAVCVLSAALMVLHFDDVREALPGWVRWLFLAPSIFGLAILLVAIWMFDANPDHNFHKVDGAWVCDIRPDDPVGWLMTGFFTWTIAVFALTFSFSMRYSWRRADRLKNKFFLVVFTVVPTTVMILYLYVPMQYDKVSPYSLSIPSTAIGFFYTGMLVRLRLFEVSPLTTGRQFMDVLPGVAIITDLEFRIRHINGYLRRQFDIEHRDIIDLPVWDVVDTIDEETVNHNISKISTLEEGRQFFGEFAFLLKGSRVDVLFTSTPVFRAGIKAGYIMLLMDISRLKAHERQLEEYAYRLEQSNRELEQFAYIVSHDIKTPLRNIISFAQLLGLKMEGQDRDAQEYLRTVHDSAKHLMQLVEDILEYASLRNAHLYAQQVDIADVISRVCDELSEDIHLRKAVVKILTPMPALNANKAMMKQLFGNLISNALKYNRSPLPLIHLSYEQVGKATHRFRISDNGIGIKAEHQSRIFDMFRRLHSQKEFPGTGIGLAICKKITELYRGRIWVESPPGEGSIFCVDIKIPKKTQKSEQKCTE